MPNQWVEFQKRHRGRPWREVSELYWAEKGGRPAAGPLARTKRARTKTKRARTKTTGAPARTKGARAKTKRARTKARTWEETQAYIKSLQIQRIKNKPLPEIPVARSTPTRVRFDDNVQVQEFPVNSAPHTVRPVRSRKPLPPLPVAQNRTVVEMTDEEIDRLAGGY